MSGTMPVRRLGPADHPALERFLRRHLDTSMFLLSNAAAGGLEYEGKRLQGVYVGRFDGDELIGVVCHAWQGNLLLQAPGDDGSLALDCVADSGRSVAGLLGPCAQVRAARCALAMTDAQTHVDNCEILYSLELNQLMVPEPIARQEWIVRRPRMEERALLAAWRAAYNVESLGACDDQANRDAASAEMAAAFAHGEPADFFVLVAEGRAVATSAFNARLPDLVQIGGVWTPPADRRRGFARAVVAGQLLIARAEGARRSILFTEQENTPARRAYESIGYRAVGDYGLTLFVEPSEAASPVS